MKIFGIPEDYCKCFLILFLIAYFMMNSDLSLNIIEGNKNKKKYEIRCNKGGEPSIRSFEASSTDSVPAPNRKKGGFFKNISKKISKKLPPKKSPSG